MKKTSKYFTLAVIGAAAMAMSSCSDFLDKQPSADLTEDKTLADWNMFWYFHTDTYNFLRHGAACMNNSWQDAATDLAETSFSTGGARTSFNIGNYYASGGYRELEDTWESRYRGIRKCNWVLAKMDSVPYDITKTNEENETLRSITRAEARTFRAYFYWEMFLRFGAIPIIEDVLDPEEDMITPYTARPTTKEYVDFIISELEAAYPDLLSYDDAYLNNNYVGRLGQPVALGLLSRIKLYMASPRFSAESGITWQDAADAAKRFIDAYGDKFTLYVDNSHEAGTDAAHNYYYALLRVPHGNANQETIFFRNDPVIYWSGISMDTPVGEGGSGGNCPSQNLVDMYDMIDGSSPFASYDATGAPVYDANGNPTINPASGYVEGSASMWANRDSRLDGTVLYQGVEWGSTREDNRINVIAGQADNPTGNANSTPTGYYMKKYIPETILSSNHGGSAYRLWTIQRYAEILLNYAEALNEVGGHHQEVCDLLDQVRHRAGITGNCADRADLTSQSAMRNFIHKERTVEFAYEEHRAWDVRRWNVAVEALSRPIYGVEVYSDGTVARKVAQQRVFEEKMYLYPVPETEVWKTGIANNPGWN
ncbi:MAG: RagB/SusD family nutrient uptake outer membrane protein [Bacteroidales bacterium]|nr:RagB/SusD family nutrient uptake outer membrane protein [Bacteroidales bacterium]